MNTLAASAAFEDAGSLGRETAGEQDVGHLREFVGLVQRPGLVHQAEQRAQFAVTLGLVELVGKQSRSQYFGWG